MSLHTTCGQIICAARAVKPENEKPGRTRVYLLTTRRYERAVYELPKRAIGDKEKIVLVVRPRRETTMTGKWIEETWATGGTGQQRPTCLRRSRRANEQRGL